MAGKGIFLTTLFSFVLQCLSHASCLCAICYLKRGISAWICLQHVRELFRVSVLYSAFLTFLCQASLGQPWFVCHQVYPAHCWHEASCVACDRHVPAISIGTVCLSCSADFPLRWCLAESSREQLQFHLEYKHDLLVIQETVLKILSFVWWSFKKTSACELFITFDNSNVDLLGSQVLWVCSLSTLYFKLFENIYSLGVHL